MDNILDQIDDQPPAGAGASQGTLWSEYQEAVFKAVQGPENILIQAVAGSGKTTTIIEAMRYAQGSSLFMAFNKAIAEDIRRRVTSGEVKTLNALGHRLVMNGQGGELNAKKNLDLLKPMMQPQDYQESGYTVARAIGLAKNNGFGIEGRAEGPEAFEELIDAYLDVEADKIGQFANLAYDAFIAGREDTQTFDFDDQLYLPVYHGWQFPSFGNVFVDECQDLSPIQHLMLSRLAAEDARIVAVGDRHQAIYGFRGALTDSMDVLRRDFSMTELPLSISYRCAESVVQEAQFYNPEIKARQGAPLGVVSHLDDQGRDPNLFSNVLVVCRNNAPLFKAILRHVRAKEPCCVLSNFLDSFAAFVRGFKSTYTSDLRAKLDRWYDKEVEAAERKGFRGKVAALRDKYETVKLLCADYQRTEDVIQMVKRLGEGRTGPTFATVHKSKGLEHQNVWILRPDLMPAAYAQSADQQQQEANLIYVAITRAKESLTFGEQPY